MESGVRISINLEVAEGSGDPLVKHCRQRARVGLPLVPRVRQKHGEVERITAI